MTDDEFVREVVDAATLMRHGMTVAHWRSWRRKDTVRLRAVVKDRSRLERKEVR
jgi:hypothetical protein